MQEGIMAYALPRNRDVADARCETATGSLLRTLGRVIYGGYFLFNGINHFTNRRMLAEHAGSKRVPVPEAAVLGSGAILVAGGLSMMTGIAPRAGATLITTFLLGATPLMHDFWEIEDPEQRVQEFINFTKNMALVGAACLAATPHGPAPIGLTARDADDLLAT